MYGGSLDALRRDVSGVAFTDAQVVEAIGDVYRRHGYVLDPHGAIGWLAINDALTHAGPGAQGVFLATAHPAKFREVVEPAIGRPVPLPDALAEAVKRPRHALPLPADYAALHDAVEELSLARLSRPYRPPPGESPSRDGIPERYRWDLSSICQDWDDWGRALSPARGGDRRVRAPARHAGQRPRGSAGGAARHGRGGGAELSGVVLRGAPLRRRPARQRRQRQAPAGPDRVRPPAAGQRVVQPGSAGHPARDHPAVDGGRRRPGGVSLRHRVAVPRAGARARRARRAAAVVRQPVQQRPERQLLGVDDGRSQVSDDHAQHGGVESR